MSKFRIQHTTRYLYEDAVRDSANQVMLYPIRDENQDVLEHTITISGNPLVSVHQDYYGNQVGTFTHAQPHRELMIHSQLSVATRNRPLPADEKGFDVQWDRLRQLGQSAAFIDFLRQERFSAFTEVEKIVGDERGKNCTPFESANHFCQYVYDTFSYQKGITTVETTLDEIWKLKSGVCQDFAHILLAMLRHPGIPARYVSGYVCPNSKTGMRGEGATHAWVEIYLPDYGWLGVDPTNNCIVGETHVRLAVGRSFSDCSPVKGTYRGISNHTLEVTVSVAYEDGNVSDDQAAHQPRPATMSVYKNSFRKHQEMQQQ